MGGGRQTLDNIQRLKLFSPTATRKTIARYIGLLQRTDSEQIDHAKLKLILDFLREYRQMFALEKGLAVEKELREIRAMLEERKK